MTAKILPFFPAKARSPAGLTADIIAHLVSRPDFSDAVDEAAVAIDTLEAGLQQTLPGAGDIRISEATISQLSRDIAALRNLVGFWQAKIGEARAAREQEAAAYRTR